MRATNLVKVAAQAKIFRIQHMLKRQGVRAAFGLAVNLLIAMIFGLLAVLVGFGLLRIAALFGGYAREPRSATGEGVTVG
jgi:hypothetical protein